MADEKPTAGAPTPEQQAQQVQAWLRAPVARIYTNGFVVAQTASDISVIMLMNGMPAAITSMSFISAKSLMDNLRVTIEEMEKLLAQQIPTIEEITSKMAQQEGSRVVRIT